jgi:RNA polymerase sigma-70 factor (ECF subfamily)
MRTVAWSRLGEGHAADDVLQEVAVLVLEHTSRPTDPRKVAPWLYRITIRQAINWRRRRGRQRRLLQRLAERSPAGKAEAPDPRDWVLGRELRGAVAAALEHLAPQDREILLLKYTEDWSYRELAEHLGVTIKTVEYRLLKARRALRARLREFGSQGDTHEPTD